MFGAPESLIVVYKDKMLANQLKKLIQQKDDKTDGVIGTPDDSFEVVTWDEKTWLANEKKVNITSKVLLLGNIKGTDQLIPVLDEMYNEFGIHYGWAGKQAVIYAEPKEIKALDKYLEFYNELMKSEVPQAIKDLITLKSLSDEEQDITESIVDEPVIEDKPIKEEKSKFFKKGKAFMKTAQSQIKKSFNETSKKVQDFSEENFKNKKHMEQQMLFYGVIKLYYEGLESFMNS